MNFSQSDNEESGFSILGFILGILAVISVVGIFFFFLKKDEVHVKEKGFVKEPKVNEKILDKLNTRQKKIFDLLVEKDEVTVGDIMKKVKGVSERTLRRDMGTLESLGYSKKLGSTKGSKYILVK